MQILVAIDDSPCSAAVLEEVCNRPWPDDANFRVLTVVEPFHPENAGWHTSYVPIALEAQHERLNFAKHLVEESAERLSQHYGKTHVSTEAVEGYIKDTILQVASNWPADLIVMGTHGRKGLERFLLGSVSHSVSADAPCSVEIVKVVKDRTH